MISRSINESKPAEGTSFFIQFDGRAKSKPSFRSCILLLTCSNKNYPIRQRSLNGKPELSIAESGALIDILDERIRDGSEDYAADPECDERQFCEISRKGNGLKASTVEKIFWRLAHR